MTASKTSSLQANCASTHVSEHGKAKRRQQRVLEDQSSIVSFDEYRQQFRLASIGSQFDIIANNVYASEIDVEIPSAPGQEHSNAVADDQKA